jgi:hypothetical protein
MKKILLIAILFITTSCITVSENTLPEEEFANAVIWGGSVSVLYKVEQTSEINPSMMRYTNTLQVSVIESAIKSTLEQHFDTVQIQNANFTNWPKHHNTDYKINISVTSDTNQSFLHIIGGLFHIYSLGIIPYTQKNKDIVRIEILKGNKVHKVSTKEESYRLWSSLFFAFNSEGEAGALSIPYIKNQLRAALNEAHKKH